MSAPNSARRPALGLAWRLFAAMGLVVVAGAGTLLVAALLVAQPVFGTHFDQIRPLVSAQAQTHVEEAFASAVLISLSVAVTIALAAALVVTWLVARRVATPVAEAAQAARQIADGDYEARLRQPGLGPEFDALTSSFNMMASQLMTTEKRRRSLLADLAHELRTPLASMQATIEAVADGILPADQTTLRTLTEQSERLHRLVGDLSAVSRAEERQLNLRHVVLSLPDLVSATVAAARPRFIAKGVSLTLEAGGPCQAEVDADRLAEALGALLDNALRHTGSGGDVTVSTARHSNECQIVVTDTGEGFDPATAVQIFERFYRGDTSRKAGSAGSGIGLTIARAILQAHRGQLTGHSAGRGTGATFEITLPMAGKPDPRNS